MLSVLEQHALEELANDFIAQVKLAIETKPVKRKTKSQGDFQGVVNASGRLANSLRFEIDETVLRVFCLSYIDDLIYGKPPSRLDDTTVFEIENWINSKGLELNAESVMYNLQKRGSSIYQQFQGANSGLLEDVNFEVGLEKVKKALFLTHVESVSQNYINQFK